ncbi:MAG: M1 family aminopeptidase [Myxococcota bacterium]
MFSAWSLGAFAGPLDPAVRLPSSIRPVRASVEFTLDPASPRFSGVERLVVQLDRPADHLSLHARDLTFGAVTLTTGEADRSPVTVTEHPGWVDLSWDSRVSGEVTLELAWTGSVSELDTQGLFRQREGDDWYLFSQFEAMDARRAFPCFDQPEFKIPWEIALVVPDGARAYGNAPASREEAAGPGQRRVVFAPTLPLPTYLVAFAVGPFDEVDAGRVGEVPLRIIVPRGRADWATYAVETAAPTVAWFEAYFGQPFPYPKLDVVSLPQAVGWGAMENPGLITMVQGAVLARPGEDSAARRRRWRVFFAHEVAHQWFGDLVTPRWWDDLWLNESFASWMESRALAELEPGWGVAVDQVTTRSAAMAADSLAAARAIRRPAETVDDIEGAFDAIVYAKGESVLVMLEAWLGRDVFRDGVRRYLQAHAHGTATASDFAAALTAAAAGAPALGPRPVDLSHLLDTFIEQPGAPQVDVTLVCDDGPPRLDLKVERYLPAGSRGRTRQTWDLPVCARWGGGAAPGHGCALVTGRAATLPLGPSCPTWVQPNDGETGYYRVRYRGDLLQTLLASGELSTAEKVGVLDAATAAVDAGDLSPTTLLAEIPGVVELGDPHALRAAAEIVAALDQHLITDDTRPAYQAFVRRTFGEAANAVGRTSSSDDGDATRRLRIALLDLVGRKGEDPELLAYAREQSDRWLTDRTGIDAELVEVMLGLAAHGGDRALYDRMYAEASGEQDRDRRELLFAALGSFRDPDAVGAALGASLDPAIDLREAFGLLTGPLGDPVTRPAAWAFVQANTDALAERIPAIARSYLILSGAGWCDASRAAEVESLFADRSRRWVNGRSQLAQVLEGIEVCAASVEDRRSEVAAFLSSR